MTGVLVVYHSQTGNTLKMAESVADGAAAIEGVRVTVKQALDAGLDDLVGCDGLIIGSPEYFGYMAGMIKDFFDRTYDEAKGRKDVFRKPYALFVSAGNDGRGTLTAIERICTGYQLKKVCEPVVARGEITRQVLAQCEALGKTVAAGCEAGIY
ncbi:MAG: NAD(P)H-dependent oxidoreductase [Deltaproteobacteria bacterium]|nr:NAD(P)H-dependent oxidoreductase [Deltaproteobacteria bacterium]